MGTSTGSMGLAREGLSWAGDHSRTSGVTSQSAQASTSSVGHGGANDILCIQNLYHLELSHPPLKLLLSSQFTPITKERNVGCSFHDPGHPPPEGSINYFF